AAALPRRPTMLANQPAPVVRLSGRDRGVHHRHHAVDQPQLDPSPAVLSELDEVLPATIDRPPIVRHQGRGQLMIIVQPVPYTTDQRRDSLPGTGRTVVWIPPAPAGKADTIEVDPGQGVPVGELVRDGLELTDDTGVRGGYPDIVGIVGARHRA